MTCPVSWALILAASSRSCWINVAPGSRSPQKRQNFCASSCCCAQSVQNTMGNKPPVTSDPYEGGSGSVQDSSDIRTNIPHTSTPAAAALSLTSMNCGCSMISPISWPPATSNEHRFPLIAHRPSPLGSCCLLAPTRLQQSKMTPVRSSM